MVEIKTNASRRKRRILKIFSCVSVVNDNEVDGPGAVAKLTPR